MPLTLQQLTQVVTKDQALQTLIEEAAELGFNSTSWQSGSVQRTMLELLATLQAGASSVISKIAASGFNELASGDWLALFSKSHYDNDKKTAVATQGTEVLSCAASAGPYTITASQLVFADTVSGRTFRNTTGGVLSSGGTLSVTIEAEVAGAAGDVPPNTITVLKTPLAGVTCNNPIPNGSSSWITRNGSDDESDPALRDRNSSKWATLASAGTPGLAYKNFAAQADASVKRVFVDDQNPRGPGTLDIYVAGDAGELSSTVVTAVANYLDGTTDGIGRQGTGADVAVYSALRRDVTVQATIYLVAQYNTTATQQAILDAIAAYFKTLEIGGTKLAVGGQGYVVFGALYQAILSIPGVRNAAFLTPTADLPIAKNEVAVGVPVFSYMSV